MGRDLLLKKITDAKESLPETLLVYLDREINDKNVKAEGYLERKLSELIKEDILYISSYSKSKIRAIVGEVGSGKTILLNKFKENFIELLKNNCVVFFLNFSDISVTDNKDFAKDISKTIYNQIKEHFYFFNLHEYNDEQLSEYFNDFKIIDAIMNIRNAEIKAKRFFFEEITEGNLVELLEGYLKIAFSKNFPVLFIIDELNYLIKNDPNENKILTNIIIQRLLRGWWRKFTEKPLFLITSCLTEEFSKLPELNPSFYSIIKRNIIKLDKLSKEEKRILIELIYQEYKKYLNRKLDLTIFIDEIEKRVENIKNREKLDYYITEYARDFVQIIATVMSENIEIDYLQKSYYIYEEDSREFIKPKLKDKGFDIKNMPNKEFNYDGFGIDIYSEDKSNRQKIKHALGECKSQKFNSGHVDEWDYKLLKLEHKDSYSKDDDFIFTIAPNYTKKAKQRLTQMHCKVFYFESERAKNLAKLSKKTSEKKPKKIQKKIKDKKITFDDLTRAQKEFCQFIRDKGGKVGIKTLNSKFEKDKASRLIRELEKSNKIEKVKLSYKLK